MIESLLNDMNFSVLLNLTDHFEMNFRLEKRRKSTGEFFEHQKIMANRLFMQLLSCVNVLTVIHTGLQQLEDEWKAFKASHPAIAKKNWYASTAQDFVEEGIAPDLRHAIEMVTNCYCTVTNCC